jgi:hypothetical protein
MLNLIKTQQEFQKALLDEESSPPSFILSTEKVSAETRFDVYNEAYRWRLVECLENNYPILAKYLGEEDFSALALGYVEYYPSEYRNVRWFGDCLPEFMSQTEEYDKNLFLIELANLEWIFSLVFDAADAPILNFSDLANISPEKWPNLILKMHPSVYRLDLHWNSTEIWEALMQEAERCPDPKKHKTAEAWIFWRKNLDITFCYMDSIESKIFDLAAQGKTWQELCEALLPFMSEEEIPNYIAPLLGKWLEAGLISSFLSLP